MDAWQAVAVGLIPSIGVGLVFWFVMRAVMRADRSERAALAQIDRDDAAAPPADAPAAPVPGGTIEPHKDGSDPSPDAKS